MLLHTKRHSTRALYAEITTRADFPPSFAVMSAPSTCSAACQRRSSCDHQKLVVLSRAGGQPHCHPEFLEFAGQFGFAPQLCRPYRARTKGKVERSIGYVRDRFFCGRTFNDVADANEQLLHWLMTVANERTHATTGEKPAERLKHEGLVPVGAARPWTRVTPAAPLMPPRVTLRFAPPVVEERSLSVYEEVTT